METGRDVTTREWVHRLAAIAVHKIIKASVLINLNQFKPGCFASCARKG
jgi:hypothetical protein